MTIHKNIPLIIGSLLYIPVITSLLAMSPNEGNVFFQKIMYGKIETRVPISNYDNHYYEIPYKITFYPPLPRAPYGFKEEKFQQTILNIFKQINNLHNNTLSVFGIPFSFAQTTSLVIKQKQFMTDEFTVKYNKINCKLSENDPEHSALIAAMKKQRPSLLESSNELSADILIKIKHKNKKFITPIIEILAKNPITNDCATFNIEIVE